MINHIGPQAAITLSQQMAVKYQTSNDTSPDAYVAEVMEAIEPILTHESVRPAEYLNAVKVPATMETVSQGQDELSQRRREFMEALVAALNKRSQNA